MKLKPHITAVNAHYEHSGNKLRIFVYGYPGSGKTHLVRVLSRSKDKHIRNRIVRYLYDTDVTIPAFRSMLTRDKATSAHYIFTEQLVKECSANSKHLIIISNLWSLLPMVLKAGFIVFYLNPPLYVYDRYLLGRDLSDGNWDLFHRWRAESVSSVAKFAIEYPGKILEVPSNQVLYDIFGRMKTPDPDSIDWN